MNEAFYKWLLGREKQLSLPDLELLDPDIFASIKQLLNASDEDLSYMQHSL